MNGGVIECHGNNDDYQLGLAAPFNISSEDTKGYTIVGGDLGLYHICVIVKNRSNRKAVMCRGLNDLGQLGVGYKSSNPLYLKDFHFVLAGEQPENN